MFIECLEDALANAEKMNPQEETEIARPDGKATSKGSTRLLSKRKTSHFKPENLEKQCPSGEIVWAGFS